MDKLIITAALLGGGTSRAASPYVPITPDEIAADVVAVAKAGAAVVHLHARDDSGLNTMETDRFAEVYEKSVAACRKANVDVVFNLTTSGGKFPPDMRMAHLNVLKPEMCSYVPGSLNWGDYAFVNAPNFLDELGQTILDNEIKPEIEIFDAGMMNIAKRLAKRGVLKSPLHFQLVMNTVGGIPGTVRGLTFLHDQLPPDATWSIAGIGKTNMNMTLASLALGCTGVRTGLEDTVLMDKGVFATNVSLVERAVALGTLAGRQIATAEEARALLGITRTWKS